MGIIRILPEHLTNKIAAGEVVERPSSVVKELMENALDAQASRISVDIKHGGKSFIKVADNGTGMDRADAELCIKSHTTSKIRELEDIFSIASLGFRGEALSSIAAVSRLTLKTRDRSQEVGTEMHLIGGRVESLREIGIPVGTTIEVADLFFNTPARKKFLKGEKSEYAAIAEIITTTGLAHPGVAFKFARDNETVFDYPPSSHLQERILQTHYREWDTHLLPLDTAQGGISIRGYIAGAGLSRTNRTAQLFFINRRPIKSLPLSYALQRGYDGLLAQGHFPVAIILLDIDPALVDVNVHPTNREVKLQDERSILEVLTHAVRKLLLRGNHAPSLSFAYALDKNKKYFPRASEAPPEAGRKKEAARDMFRYPEVGKDALPVDLRAGEPDAPPAYDRQNRLEIKALLGQIGLSYILAETEEGLIILDQHAAHERIVFEDILTTLESSAPVSQPLLFPLTLELSFREAQLLEEYLTILTGTGFGIRHLGKNTYCVDATPPWLENRASGDFIRDFLHEIMEGKAERSLHERREESAKILACKARTVKANERLSQEEMAHLVKRLEKTKRPFTCPHGRPTFITLTLDDLDKQFKRK